MSTTTSMKIQHLGMQVRWNLGTNISKVGDRIFALGNRVSEGAPVTVQDECRAYERGGREETALAFAFDRWGTMDFSDLHALAQAARMETSDLVRLVEDMTEEEKLVRILAKLDPARQKQLAAEACSLVAEQKEARQPAKSSLER